MHNEFADKHGLRTKMAKASGSVHTKCLKTIMQHPMNHIDECSYKHYIWQHSWLV
jgi:hypothetical protein